MNAVDATENGGHVEIAAVQPERLIPAQASAPYDCLIGEKIWRDIMDTWDW